MKILVLLTFLINRFFRQMMILRVSRIMKRVVISANLLRQFEGPRLRSGRRWSSLRVVLLNPMRPFRGPWGLFTWWQIGPFVRPMLGKRRRRQGYWVAVKLSRRRRLIVLTNLLVV